MKIDNKFEFGQLVYLRHDQMQSERMVTAFMVSKYDVTYELTCGLEVSRHYDYEISDIKTIY